METRQAAELLQSSLMGIVLTCKSAELSLQPKTLNLEMAKRDLTRVIRELELAVKHADMIANGRHLKLPTEELLFFHSKV